MIEFVFNDIKYWKNEGVDIIAHQVNCHGVMGSGVAKVIRDCFPQAFTEYKNLCACHTGPYRVGLLGTTQFVDTSDNDGNPVVIANMFGQENYGHKGGLYTNYNALRCCLEKLKTYADNRIFDVDTPTIIAMPFKIGCGLGGGNWKDVVYPMIREVFDSDKTVVLKLFNNQAKKVVFEPYYPRPTIQDLQF